MPDPMNCSRCCMILLISFLAAYGCIKVGPDFTPPAVKLAKSWQDADELQLKTGPKQYRSWWRVFNDPHLDQLIETAYRENLTLRIAGVRVLEARAQLGIAVGEWYPQTQQAFGNFEKVRLSAHAPSAAGQAVLNFYQSQAGLNATWELDFWGKFRRAIESADAQMYAAIADYDTVLVSLTADVATSYILIRTLEKRLDIARQNVATQQESLHIAELRFKGGTTSERDVQQAQTILSNTQAVVPTFQIQLRQAKNALCVLLGMPPARLEDLLGSARDIPAPPVRVVVGIPAELLRRRPDIRSAEFQAAAQCAQIGVAKAELFPAFSLSGTFGFLASDVGSSHLNNMFDWRSRTGTAGPAFQWNLLNYGQITNLVRVQDARFQELLISYQNTVLKAQQEVDDALVAFLRSQERAGFLAESTRAAQNSLNLAILQYREGTTDFTTVLTAQQSLLVSQDSFASTLGDISSNLVAVYRALGGGWQMREGQDIVPEAIKAEMAERTGWGKLLQPAASVPADPEKGRPPVRSPDW
jgi:NodT family efflux transporter outer membrane factor (OMF) lipoprotein